jgi:hypothetical protein
MRHQLSRRLAPALAALSTALLVACGDDGSDESRFSAALYGPVSSPAFDALRGLLTVSDQVASAQVLVVDGDAHSPGALANDAVIQQHLRDGKWVLLVDLTKDHNDRDLVPLAHSSGAGDSHVAVLRRRSDAFGRPAIDLYDFPRAGSAAPTAGQLSELPRSVAEFLRKTPASAPAGFTPPAGLIYVTFNFTQPTDSYLFTATKGGTDSTNGTQNTSVNRNFVYSLFLDNQNTPTGAFQQLLVHDTVQATPLNPALGTSALMITKTGSSFVTCDIGWFQVGVDHSVVAANPSRFTPQDNSPQNTNEQAQVTSGVSFGINFSNPLGSGGGTATYSESVSYNVTQWNVVNPTTGSWSWQNQDPWKDGNTNWDSYGFGGGVKGFGEFRVPNTLAAGLLVADTKVLYETPAVLSSVETFHHTTTVTYLNVWAAALGPIEHQYVELPLTSSWQINMGAVIPVPIASLNFAPDPVNAASVNQTTGTVTLSAAAPMDTIVYLQSNSQNATVLQSVTIPQGQTSGTFQVLVNTNNIASGGATVATILASNAVAFQSQLTVKNGP